MAFRTRRSPVLVALSKKRSLLTRELIDLQEAFQRKQVEIITLDATIHMLDIQYDMELARPRRVYTRTFDLGELKRLIIGILKEADKPLTTRQISDEVCRQKRLFQDCRRKVKNALQSYRVTVKVGETDTGLSLWTLKTYAAKTKDAPARLRLV